MIYNCSFRNFKAYRSLDLDLEPFTVIVGPNASGKTTLLEGLRLSTGGLARLMAGDLVKLSSHGSQSPLELSVWGVWMGKTGAVRIELNYDLTREDKDWGGTSVSWGGETYIQRFGGTHSRSGTPPPSRLDAAFETTAVLRFDPRRLAEPAYSDKEVPIVRYDGGGLAAVLAYLKLSDDESFQLIESSLREIVPAVKSIKIERAKVEHMVIALSSLDVQPEQVPENRVLWGHKIVLDMDGAKKVPVDAVGEGTLMALGLLTVLLGPTKPHLLLLDDIELALHPVAQGKLIGILRRIQAQNPELQIVATSHSPFVLNYLEPKEVRIAFLAENGFARCEKLTAHPEFERWKDMMSPGEFWSSVGESWVEKVAKPAAHE